MPELFTPYIALSNPYDQSPCVLRYVACHVGQVIDHRPAYAAFYRPLQPGISPAKRFLPYHAQDVIRQDGKFQNQFICLKLSGRQALKNHIGLQFAVELPFPVCCAFRDFISHADCRPFFRAVLRPAGDFLPATPGIDGFTVPGTGDIHAIFLRHLESSLLSLRRLRLMIKWQPFSMRIPMFSANHCLSQAGKGAAHLSAADGFF